MSAAEGPLGEPAPPPPSLTRSAAIMAGGTALSRITGLGRLMAAAFALGVAESRLADSYNIANTLPNVIYELVLGGVLTSVFIPVVVEELRTRPREEAWQSVSTLATTALAVLAALSLLAMVAAPWLVKLFTFRVGGAEGADQQEIATFFLRVFAPQILLYGMAAVAAGLLNAHDRFAVPMFAPILNNLIVIATFLGFAALVAGTPTSASVGGSTGQKLMLGLGTTAGVAAMAAVHWPFVRRLPGKLRARFDLRHPAVRKLARLSGWTLGYVGLNQIGFAVILVLANEVQGGPTAFFTALAFFQLPYGIIAVSVMTALVPTLSAQHVDGDEAGFRARTAGGLRAIAMLLIPATGAYLVLSRPLVRILLEHGVMGPESGDLVARVLDMLVLGLLPFSAYLLFVRAFYARQDARTPLIVNGIDNGLTVVLCFVLFPSLEVRGLALAHSIGYLVAAVVAGILLARRCGGLEGRRTAAEMGKVVVATVAATAAMAAVVALVASWSGPGDLRAILQLGLGGATGLVVLLGSARVLAVEDVELLRRLVRLRR